MPPPEKPEKQPTPHDTPETQEVADAGRLIRAGVRTKDLPTQGAGTARLIRQVGTNIPTEFAKAVGLDQVETGDD